MFFNNFYRFDFFFLEHANFVFCSFLVVSHSGTEAQKGHYITEVYHVGLNKWLRCDDSNVKVTDLNQVLKGGETNLVPYLLFYRRYDTIARENEQFVPKSNDANNFVTQNRYSRN